MIIALSGKKESGKDTVGNIIQYLIWKDKLDREEFYISKNYDYKYFTEVASSQDILSGWKIKKFADKLKDIVCLLLGCTREQLEDREFKEKELGEEWWYFKDSLFTERMLPYLENRELDNDLTYYIIKLTPRTLLQLLGTECGRQIIHPNIWVNSLMSDYKDKTVSKGKLLKKPIYPNWIITDTRFPNELKAVKDREGITIRVNRNPENKWIDKQEWDLHTKGIVPHESETALDNAEFDYVIDNNGTIEELVEKVREILIKEKLL